MAELVYVYIGNGFREDALGSIPAIKLSEFEVKMALPLSTVIENEDGKFYSILKQSADEALSLRKWESGQLYIIADILQRYQFLEYL